MSLQGSRVGRQAFGFADEPREILIRGRALQAPEQRDGLTGLLQERTKGSFRLGGIQGPTGDVEGAFRWTLLTLGTGQQEQAPNLVARSGDGIGPSRAATRSGRPQARSIRARVSAGITAGRVDLATSTAPSTSPSWSRHSTATWLSLGRVGWARKPAPLTRRCRVDAGLAGSPRASCTRAIDPIGHIQ